MNVLRATLLLAAAAGPEASQAGGLGRLAPGTMLPEVTLPALDDGHGVSLRSLCRGRKTILVNFASW